ncbi:hypothetical protein D9M68_507510 [compost metagenome]
MSQLIEPKLTIEPPPSARMSLATACAAKNWCLMLTATRRSKSSLVTSAISWRRSLAALFSSTDTGPKRWRTASMAAASAAVSVTSQGTNSAGCAPCSCAASAAPAAVSRSQKPTFAPWA